ncbi:MAG: HIRAN domain-containing protein [Firmicutes bacterium]|nr:HIRAN domain-containing protein [Candidatus Fermentithermobacillaceae bacterium]
MLNMLSAIIEKGFLKGIPVDSRGEFDPGIAVDLCRVLQGVSLIRCGALLAGVQVLAEVKEWHNSFVQICCEFVPRERLLNALAEAMFAAFKPEHRLGLLFGAALGADFSKVYKFYEEAPQFITRVVGPHHGDPLGLKRLKAGQPAFLVREPANPYDPNAISVRDFMGAGIGYIRATIAERLAPIMDKGVRFSAAIEVVLDDRFSPNDRIYVAVRREADQKMWQPNSGISAV